MLFSADKKCKSESDIRFSVIDPLIKAINRCTGAYISATPDFQAETSSGSVPDYQMYTVRISPRNKIVALLAEAKQKWSDDGVCQLIGYNMVSKVSSVIDNQQCPPLAILVCGDSITFVFFPFIEHDSLCADAIVSQPFQFVNKSFVIEESVFSFICYYILNQSHCSPVTDCGIALHPKKTYQHLIEVLNSAQQLLQAAEQIEEQKQRAERQKQRAERQKQRAERQKRRAEQAEEQIEEEKQRAERQKWRAERQAERQKRRAEQAEEELRKLKLQYTEEIGAAKRRKHGKK